MSTAAQERRLREIERRYARLSAQLSRFDLQATPTDLTGEDGGHDVLGELLSPTASSSRYLGFYTLEGGRTALEHLGYLELLRARGYPDVQIDLDLSDPFRHVLRLYDGPERTPDRLLVDLRMRLADAPERGPFEGSDAGRRSGYLVVEWLALQSPRQRFDARRGLVPLPGQRFPGLGVGAQTLALVVRIAERLGKRGVLTHPSWYHNAIFYRPRFRFIDPAAQGMLDALIRDMAGYTLGEVAWAVDLGAVTDLDAGAPYGWQSSEELLPLVPEDAAWFDSDEYAEARRQAAAERHFRLDRTRLSARLDALAGGDDPVPTSADLRQFGAMPTVRCILVPTDLSKAASAAYPVARAFARAFDSAVRLGYVRRPGAEAAGDDAAARGEGAALEAIAARMRADGAEVHSSIQEGQPAVQLLRAPESCSFDLVVMARRTRTGLVPLRLGATTDHMVREANVPVVVVPATMADTDVYRARRILYPVDLSDFSSAGVPFVKAVAETLGAAVEVVHVVDSGDEPPAASEGAPTESPIDRFFDLLSRFVPEASRTLLRSGNVARTLLDRARDGACDLIVMPSHGKGFVQRLLVGSVTSRVLDESTVPVLILPPDLLVR